MLQLFPARLLAPLIGAALLIAGGFAAAEAYEHRAPWGLAHKRDAAVKDAKGWRQAQADTRAVALRWARQEGQQRQLRDKETTVARAAVTELQAQCATRVAKAKASALAIQAIIRKELPKDAKGCPVRGLIDARELRNAVSPGP